MMFDLVPRELASNLHFRRGLYDLARTDEDFRFGLLDACESDCLFFVGVFGWLQEVRPCAEWERFDRYEGGSGTLPFVPRGYQIRSMGEMLDSLGRRDIIAPKSRETGVSWMCVAIAVWDMLFHGAHIGFVSRDEDSVDSNGPGSLFSKVQFFLDHLPCWMLTSGDYTRNVSQHTIEFHRSGGSLHGVATGPNIFRGDRKKWVLMDEAHFFRDDYAARDSLIGVTRSRVMVSTLNRERGASGAFYEAWQDADAAVTVIEIDWSEDVDKARGLYTTDHGRLKILDEAFWRDHELPGGGYSHPYRSGAEYEFQLDDTVRSLYYDYEGSRAGVNRQTLAAELDRDVTGATAQLCDSAVLKDALRTCPDPDQTGTLLPCTGGDGWEWDWTLPGEAKLWCILVDGNPPESDYVMGADIAAGTGGSYSSYSCLAVFDRKTGEQVFEWRSNRVNPLAFADLARHIGLWFSEAYFVPEANGPIGTLFMEELVRLGYPRLYFQKRGKKSYRSSTDRPGYWNGDGGGELLTTLEAGIKTGRSKVKSRLCLKEMGNYFYRNGKLVQARAQADEDEGARGQAHGDMAIATGAAWWGVRDLPVWKEETPVQRVPVDCFSARRAAARERDHQKSVKSYWNPWT